ncbi:MAG TPA: DUF2264 domain-containing protein [Fulvivirga sp.]|nr:DUF2264 domain-containing protein [Fulvivirga sp.]
MKLTPATRELWLKTMLKIARPVFHNFANDNFKNVFEVDAFPKNKIPIRSDYAHLEALGRSLAGIGPWLNLENDINQSELQMQSEMRQLVMLTLDNATNSTKSDFLNFKTGKQPLVDAAFLAVGLLRAWDSIWLQLPDKVKSRIITCLKATRIVKPNFSNWLLFSGVIEAFLAKSGEKYDLMRIDYCLNQLDQWYLGAGTYSDGPTFKYDYYNSYVIHPFILEILEAINSVTKEYMSFYNTSIDRLKEYSEFQEKIINPDGSYPILGRSITYRFGAFHALAFASLHDLLPANLSNGAVRGALTAVLTKTLLAENTLNTKGWLTIGVNGKQPELAENYLSSGSMYISLCGFLPLGLSSKSRFWTDIDEPWSSYKVWGTN